MLGRLGDNVTVLAVECNFPPLSPQLCGSDTAGARRVTSREKSTEAEREKKHQQEEELFPANKAEWQAADMTNPSLTVRKDRMDA